MNTRNIIIGLLAAALLVPTAASAGYLVNVETPWINLKHGSNIAGGSGDTVDVGVFNHQCSDENDVVDVGVANREGDASCGYTGEGCHAEQGESRLGLELLGSPDTEYDPHCSDDGDTVDVGVLNNEGGHHYRECGLEGQPGYGYEDRWEGREHYTPGTDAEDGVDAGILNNECGDDDDAVDAGVLNCETWDHDDGVDAGVLNSEYRWDGSDTFDLGVLNYEENDGPDRNDVDLGIWWFKPQYPCFVAPNLGFDHIAPALLG